MLSIPVFFDVTFIILIPIGITIAAKIDMKMCYVTGCLTIVLPPPTAWFLPLPILWLLLTSLALIWASR